MKFGKSIVIGLLSLCAFSFVPATGAAASPTITGEVPAGVASGGTAGVSISLGGVEWDSVLVTIVVDSGGLVVDLVGDTTESPGYDLTDSSASTQSFYGSFASVNDVLETGLTWFAPSSAGPHDLHFTITVQEQIEGLTFNPDNGHYYLVPHEANGSLTTMSGADAFAAAEAGDFVYAGMTGYLVEITDAAENDFVAEFSGGDDVWIGASSQYSILNAYSGTSFADNVASRGKWYWVHSGTQFAEGVYNSTTAINSSFLSFASGEPNDSFSDERCLVTNWEGSSGLWNDLRCGNQWSNSMVIEFEGDAASDSVLTLTDADIQASGGGSSGNGDLSTNSLASTGVDFLPAFALAVASIALGLAAARGTKNRTNHNRAERH
jgi:hypothetical protein